MFFMFDFPCQLVPRWGGFWFPAFRRTGSLDSEPFNSCLLPVQATSACTVSLSSSPCHERYQERLSEWGKVCKAKLYEHPPQKAAAPQSGAVLM